MLARVLYLSALLAAGAALILSTLERRRTSRRPVVALVVDTYGWRSDLVRPTLLAVTAGVLVVAGPALFFTVIGWVSWVRIEAVSGSVLALGLATLAMKILLAGCEELVFRGALLEQITRRTTLAVGVLGSSLVFAFAHLGRPEVRGPFALIVYWLDGVGFSFVYLAAGSLWVPLGWHVAKNVTIWLLYSTSTLQLTGGIFRAVDVRSGSWIGGATTTGLVDLVATALVVATAVHLATRMPLRPPGGEGAG